MLVQQKNQPFIHQHSKGIQLFVHKEHGMTLTSDHLLDQNASFNISVPSATKQDITSISATAPVHIPHQVVHPQLQESMFKLVTSIKYRVLNSLLQEHPNREKVEYVVRGF